MTESKRNKRLREVKDILIGMAPDTDADELQQRAQVIADLVDGTPGGGGKRPLNQTERRALEKLVDNDFSALKSEIIAAAMAFKTEQEEVIRAEYAAKGTDIEMAESQTRALEIRFRDQLAALRSKWSEMGIRPKGRDAYRSTGAEISLVCDYQHEGMQEAVSRMHRRIESDQQNAIRMAERQRVTIQRRVLLAAIVSDEALMLLEDIPDARTLLLQAQQEAVKELTE